MTPYEATKIRTLNDFQFQPTRNTVRDQCALAVEVFDNTKDLSAAMTIIHKRYCAKRVYIKRLMREHAQVAGFDNSEALVAAIRCR